MSKVLVFLAEEFEETEAVGTIDILRRGGIDVTIVSITRNISVRGAHNINISTDILIEDLIQTENFDMLVLPGGPGTRFYKDCKMLLDLIIKYSNTGKYLAAICAAPSVFGTLGILDNKQAVCYPGCENAMGKAIIIDEPVVVDKNIITSKGPGTVVYFGLKIVEILKGCETAKKVKNDFLVVI